ncbi:hypothetical protein Hanom_Chr04g00302841 [Helianthus anomalus]
MGIRSRGEVDGSEGPQKMEGWVVNDESPAVNMAGSHMGIPMHEEGIISDGGYVNVDVGPSRNKGNASDGNHEVGSKEGFRVGGPFFSGSCSFPNGDSVRAQKKGKVGAKSRVGRPNGIKDCSPLDQRPRKRGRCDAVEVEPGFGFVGFTDRAGCYPEDQSLRKEPEERIIDLNVSANQIPPVSAASADAVPAISEIGPMLDQAPTFEPS